MANQVEAADLTRSCVVVAHPDDEILWFSAILEQVAKIVLCYQDCDDYPELGPARRAVIDAYPLPATWLRLPEPCTVQLVDWSQPEADEYGLHLNAPQVTAAQRERYRRSFGVLRNELAEQLRGFETVFTHNPWGEYGHPDHVQVARVVDALRPQLGFRQFYSGYIAPRTMPLAAPVLPRLGRWFELPTNLRLVDRIQPLYQQHGCWTWPADYQRFVSESFLEACDAAPAPGSGLRLNCVTA